MRPLLAILTLAFIATLAAPAPAVALNFHKITLAGMSFPIDGLSRARKGAPGDGCSRQVTFTMTNENAAYELKDVIISSYLIIELGFNLPNGGRGTLRLEDVSVINFGPATVDGKKGWSGTLCYGRQVLEFNGQDFE